MEDVLQKLKDYFANTPREEVLKDWEEAKRDAPKNSPLLKDISKMNKLETEIEKSKYMLDFEEDYDDEGGIPPTKETWTKVVNFLRLWNYKHTAKIYHSWKGSIDIMIEENNFRLLMNIQPDMKATWYWDEGVNIWENFKEGSIDLNTIDFNNFILNDL